MQVRALDAKRGILEEGRNCWKILPAERAAFLIDGKAYFDAFSAAVEKARRSILIVAWDVDSRILLRRENASGPELQFGRFLNRIISRRKGLHAYILAWDFAMLYAFERELFPVFRLPWRNHRRLHFRLDGKHPLGASRHGKIVVVDDAVAFVGGFDLTKMRWDTPDHASEDPRRKDPVGRRYRPFHDVQMAVGGAPAKALGDMVRDRWRLVSGARIEPPGPGAGEPWPSFLAPDFENVQVAVARTEPAGGEAPPVREVEALYLDSIASARKRIYIENQYLTSSSIGQALADRLEPPNGPEVVIVLPFKPSGWLEESTMGILQTRLLRRLQAKDRFGRLKVFYPRTPGSKEGARLNLHAKVMVVDDAFVRVGSSNLNNRSMGFDSECDLAIEAGGEGRIEKAIADFRNRLLGEHLGAAPREVERALAETESFVAAIEKLRGGERTLMPLPLEDHGLVDGIIPDHSLIDPEEPVDPDKLMDEFMPQEEKRLSRWKLIRFAVVLLLMGGLAAAWRWTPLGDWLKVEAFEGLRNSLAGNPASVFIVIGAFLVGSFMVVPVTFMVLLTTFIFGPVSGGVYALLGCLAGAVSTYFLGRLLGREKMGRLAGSRIRKVSRRLANHGLVTMTVVRLLPVAPFTVVNMVAGAAHIRFQDFVFGTLLGMLPGIVAIGVFAQQLEGLVERPEIGKAFFLAALLLAMLAAGFLVRKWLTKNRRSGVPGKIVEER